MVLQSQQQQTITNENPQLFYHFRVKTFSVLTENLDALGANLCVSRWLNLIQHSRDQLYLNLFYGEIGNNCMFVNLTN